MLFSDAMRLDSKPRGYTESAFACLDRRAGVAYDNIRHVIESWHSRFPPESKDEMKTRLSGGQDWEFQSAFLELYVHELLLQSGHSVEIHPKLPSTTKRPDFLASSGDLSTFVECLVVTEKSQEERNSDAVLNAIYESIDSVNSPDFFLSLDVEGDARTGVPRNRWRAAVQSWIDSLDYAEVLRLGTQGSFQELPELVLAHDELSVTVSPIAKSETSRGKDGIRPIGVFSGGGGWVTSRLTIKEKLKKKARRYGELNLPFVVVVNCLGEMCDHEEIEMAIYGTEGLWPIRGSTSCSKLSAVIAIYHLVPYSVSRADIWLCHNPAAAIPYRGQLGQMPQMTIAGEKVVRVDGQHPRHLFGLSPNWPDN